MNFGISSKSYRLILAELKSHSEIKEAIIFGSRAMGNFKSGSDIDIAIKGKNCNEETALTVSARLNEDKPIPYFIDVIDYSSISHTDLKNHIDHVGKVFFQNKK